MSTNSINPPIPAVDLEGITLTYDPKRGWIARDSDGDERAVLPHWCDKRQAIDLLPLVLAHEKRGREQGERAGARAEKERIQYGFRVVFSPLADVAESLQETLNERLSSR